MRKKLFRIVIFVLILVGGIAAYFYFSKSSASATWYNSSWNYRKQLTVTGSSAGAQTNYQMKMTVYKSSGTDSGSSVYLGTNVQDDFDDLRFTTSDGSTLLDYWIESYTSGTSAIVWIEFNSIPASPSTATFYLYYGNGSATSVSSGTNTFIFFDDFEDGTVGNAPSGWSGDASFVVSDTTAANGTKSVTSANSPSGNVLTYKSISAISTSFVLEASARQAATNTEGGIYLFTAGGSACNYYMRDTAVHSAYLGSAFHDGSSYSSNTWYRYKFDVLVPSGTFNAYVNNTIAITGHALDTGTNSITSVALLRNGKAKTTASYYDFILGRAYASPEPTFTTWGSEEPQPTSTPTPTLTPTPTPAAWYNSSWGYRKQLTVTGSSAGAQTNYQMKLNVYRTTGTDSGDTVYLGSNVETDFDDLRFAASDGTTLLDYWIEIIGYVGGLNIYSAVVWVEFDSIPASPSTATFYVYYGNSSATAVSSLDNTFTKNYGESGIAGLWHMDEGSGNAADSSGNSNTGTVTGATWQATDGGQWGSQSGTKFSTGSHLYFDGNDYVSVSSNSSLSLTSMTLSAWVYIPTLAPGVWHTIMEHNRSGNDNYGLWDNGSTFHFRWYKSSGVYATDFLTAISANTWYHVVGTYDASTNTAKTYLNGVLDRTVTGCTSPTAVDSALTIGRNGAGSEYFSGYIDEVRIYNRVLSADEIAAYYQRRKYASVAPTFTTWGSEEAEVTPTPTPTFTPTPGPTSTPAPPSGGASLMYSNGWRYRKSIILSRASGAVTNYQMKLTVYKSSGTDSGSSVYLGTNVQDDFDDLRFTNSSGAVLDYWIESISGTTPNQIATVWVEFDSIGTTATTFYMYYGNSSATFYSNGPNTFIYFEDFEWGNDGDSVGVSGGTLTWTAVPGTGATTEITTDQEWSGTRSLGITTSGGASEGASPYAYFPWVPTDNMAIMWRAYKQNVSDLRTGFSNGTWSTVLRWSTAEDLIVYDGSSYIDTGDNASADAWHKFELRNYNWSTGTVDVWLDDVEIATAMDITYATAVTRVSYNNYNPSVAGTSYVDNVVVRNWRTTEPAFGTWGSEQLLSDQTKTNLKGLKLKGLNLR